MPSFDKGFGWQLFAKTIAAGKCPNASQRNLALTEFVEELALWQKEGARLEAHRKAFVAAKMVGVPKVLPLKVR